MEHYRIWIENEMYLYTHKTERERGAGGGGEGEENNISETMAMSPQLTSDSEKSPDIHSPLSASVCMTCANC